MSEFWCVTLGALIGGSFSIIAVVITQLSEKRRFKQQLLLEHKLEVFRDNRNEKKVIYIELSKLLNQVSKIEFNMVDEAKLAIDLENYNVLLKDIASFIETNEGRIMLFVPNSIYSMLMRFRRDVYSFVCENKEQLYNCDDIEKIYSLIQDGVKPLMLRGKEIINALRKDVIIFAEE